MKDLRPDFYDAFTCRAGACAHTCCAGWEIAVDEDTARWYRGMRGVLGDRFRAALEQTDEGWRFRLQGREERCPFLAPSGLCDVVTALGENALCDICAMHPRFFLEVRGHDLAGVGLSCEAAAALLLGSRAPLTFVGEDLPAPVDFPGLLGLLGFSPAPLALTLPALLHPRELQPTLALWRESDPIDPRWPREVEALARALPEEVPADRPLGERILHTLAFRQLEYADPLGLERVLAYARANTALLLTWAAVAGDLPERLRRWSAQMEYSQENTDLLLGR